MAVNLKLFRDVWTCFSVQRDISGAEDLTITSEYGGRVYLHTKITTLELN